MTTTVRLNLSYPIPVDHPLIKSSQLITMPLVITLNHVLTILHHLINYVLLPLSLLIPNWTGRPHQVHHKTPLIPHLMELLQLHCRHLVNFLHFRIDY
jgi:hypothetical protein